MLKATDKDSEGETLELRGCPFCGGPPVAEPWHGGGPSKTMVSCNGDDCAVGPSVTGPTAKLAQSKWNARAAQVRLHRVVVTKQ